MCTRIFLKPELSHTWLLISEHTSATEALARLDVLTQSRPGRLDRWVVRNTRGEIIARSTVRRESS